MSEVFDLQPAFLDLYERCREMTMTSIERMFALYSATRYIVDSKISGDFVECGVWRGGSVMLIALTLQSLGIDDRTIWLYDTFDGMTAPSEHDVQAMTGRFAAHVLAEHQKTADDPFWGYAPRRIVEENVRSTGYENVRFIEGDVMKTIPEHAPQSIAVLRLDTDWYESTRHELVHLYPRIPRGGVVIIDDYGYWSGARKATDEFLDTLPSRPLLHRIDYTGRMFVV
jgi:hypothetical protein